MCCEKCWRDANRHFFLNPSKSIAGYYHELLKERKDNPCTSEEQTSRRRLSDVVSRRTQKGPTF